MARSEDALKEVAERFFEEKTPWFISELWKRGEFAVIDFVSTISCRKAGSPQVIILALDLALEEVC